MELPKNIVQIGKPDKVHKIYIEDYVVSYIKQLNRACDGKAVGLALYGRLCEEEECRYYFLYGAAKIDGLEHRGPYLSQAEKEEIAESGKKYFEEYEFLAWCSIKGEPLESLFVKVQGKGVEVEGYACFYEKNESMLNYMLLSGQKPTETLGSIPDAKEKAGKQEEEQSICKTGNTAGTSLENQTGRGGKADSTRVRPARGEWRAADFMHPSVRTVQKAEQTQKVSGRAVASDAENVQKGSRNLSSKRTEYMKLAAVAAFLVLCVIGITTLNDYGKLEDLQVAAGQVIASMTEQKLPDAGQDNIVSGGSALEAQESVSQQNVLETAMQTDGMGLTGETQSNEQSTVSGQEINNDTDLDNNMELNGDTDSDNVTELADGEGASDHQAADSQSVIVQQPQEQTEEVLPEEELPTSYTVVRGDTLISICMSRYGSLDRLWEICEMNSISNADNIQVGQTILLP
ncbi:MAG: LysM peptidoglycan-binding domain-containing protein [Lachnospiraceae bacterium]